LFEDEAPCPLTPFTLGAPDMSMPTISPFACSGVACGHILKRGTMGGKERSSIYAVVKLGREGAKVYIGLWHQKIIEA
jgi:hypothetical protein